MRSSSPRSNSGAGLPDVLATHQRRSRMEREPMGVGDRVSQDGGRRMSLQQPSLVTQMVIAEKYGIRLDTAQLAEVTRLSRGTVLNQISAGTFPIPTYLEGKLRFADFRDVVAYFDAMRQQALGAGLPA